MLALKHIRKAFAGKTVADNISLTVAEGKLLAVLGPSGCGKSTLLNIAAGLVAADGGEVWIGGENRSRMPPERRRVALMFQDYALLPHLNVWQNVAFGLKMQGVGKHEARRRAEAALAEVGLAAELGRRIDALSGGEQQRVALARALVCSRNCFCSTSLSPASTPACAASCASRRWRRSAAKISPPCWLRTTRKKRWRWPTTSR